MGAVRDRLRGRRSKGIAPAASVSRGRSGGRVGRLDGRKRRLVLRRSGRHCADLEFLGSRTGLLDLAGMCFDRNGFAAQSRQCPLRSRPDAGRNHRCGVAAAGAGQSGAGHLGDGRISPGCCSPSITAIYLGLPVTALMVVRAAEPDRWVRPALVSAGFPGDRCGRGVAHPTRQSSADTRWCRHPRVDRRRLLLRAVGHFVAAGTGSRHRARPARGRGVSMWLPYVPSAIAIVVGAVTFLAQKSRSTRSLFATGLVLVVAVLIRHLLALERKRHLLEAMADAALRDTVTGWPIGGCSTNDWRMPHSCISV